VVGNSYIGGQAHGTIWTGSGATDLGAGTYAMGINDAGQVVGSNGHAFVLTNGEYQDLGTIPGGDWSAAYGINAAGVAVGDGSTASGTFRGLIWSPQGSMVLLGAFGGASSQATGINNAGEVVGFASLPNGYQHAFSATDALMIDLGTLGGGSSYAYGINDSGAIVGDSWLASGDNPHAFVYTGGLLQDLNSLVGNGSGWELLAAYGINDSGQITGEGLFNGNPSVFLLNPIDPPATSLAASVRPIPEPSTVAMLGLVLGYALIRRSRRPRLNPY
jgi:probable HAF family extracellular repeat protein